MYDPFGQITTMTGGAVATNNPFRFHGAYQNGTGLYHMGHRYYDPSLGRFTQQDPIHDPTDPKSWNRYVYSGDDPIGFTDLDGLNAASDLACSTAAKEIVGLFTVIPFHEGRSYPTPLGLAGSGLFKYAETVFSNVGSAAAKESGKKLFGGVTKLSLWATVAGTVADVGQRYFCD